MTFKFDENVRINESLTWGMLKYGFCSYFSLAYTSKYPSKEFLAVMEYDEDLEKEYLVHFLVIDDDRFIDAEGTYKNWKMAVKDITDIAFMTLRTREVDKDFVMEMIEEDMGYEEGIYRAIHDFVHRQY